MVGGCSMSVCPCLGTPETLDDGHLDPVLLVTGLGGCILESKSKRNIFGFDTRVWLRLFLADLVFRRKLWSIYNPSTGYTEELDKNSEIVVPDDDHGLYAIDNLDPSLFVKYFHLTKIHQFHEMIDMLVDCGYKKGTTLFGYGYDFRQSIRIDKLMEGLKVKLETAHKASGGRQVNIISHSLGGLLIMSFMTLYPDVFSKYVSKWICIACPFQGAAGCANDALLTGMQFVEGFKSHFFVGRWTIHQLVVECPSMYEILPNPDFKWKKAPQIRVWRKVILDNEDEEALPSAKIESYGLLERHNLFEEALRHNELCFKGKTYALPFNHAIQKWTAGTRQLLNKAKLPKGVAFYNIYGTSFETPFDVSYGSETSPIDDLSEVCHQLPNYSFVDGDLTVPCESAQGDGFDAVERVGIPASHRELLKDKTVFEFIQKWLGVSDANVTKHGKPSKTNKVMDAV